MRIGNSGDSSWAGWAISSFTNKMTAARGEMEPSANGSTSAARNELRPASHPASGRNTPAILLPSENLRADQNAQDAITANPLVLAGQEPHDAFEAWGAMEDGDDSFFDASSSIKRSQSPRTTTNYEEEGEPDFAGWLAAKSQNKSNTTLPKGLTKTSTTKPGRADRNTLAGTMGAGADAKKLLNTTSKPDLKEAVPAKKIDTKPQEIESTEDGWGDDWD